MGGQQSNMSSKSESESENAGDNHVINVSAENGGRESNNNRSGDDFDDGNCPGWDEHCGKFNETVFENANSFGNDNVKSYDSLTALKDDDKESISENNPELNRTLLSEFDQLETNNSHRSDSDGSEFLSANFDEFDQTIVDNDSVETINVTAKLIENLPPKRNRSQSVSSLHDNIEEENILIDYFEKCTEQVRLCYLFTIVVIRLFVFVGRGEVGSEATGAR